MDANDPMFTRDVLLRLGASVAVACVAFGGVIGVAGAPAGESFGWEVAVLAATGVATILLATFTALLAISTFGLAKTTAMLARITGQDASATQELVKIAQEDQRRAIEPVLVVAKRERIAVSTEGGIPDGHLAAHPAKRW